MKKVYVIVEFNDIEGLYNSVYSNFAIDGLFFKSKKDAEDYKLIKPNNKYMTVEELILCEPF